MTERDVPDDLMKVAREVSQEIEDTATYGWEAGLDHFASVPIIARALAAERERATLAEREKWQVPPGPTCMGFPVRFDPNMAPGETRIEDKDGNVIGRIVNARP